MSLIKIDGAAYNIGAVELKRNGEIIYDSLTRGTALDFSEIADAVATRYSYTFSIEPRRGAADANEEYDAFYLDITTPKSKRFVELPFAQTTIAFWAKVKAVSDVLYKSYGGNRWGGLNITFTPVQPQRYNKQI